MTFRNGNSKQINTGVTDSKIPDLPDDWLDDLYEGLVP
jgi:hypothetical protein